MRRFLGLVALLAGGLFGLPATADAQNFLINPCGSSNICFGSGNAQDVFIVGDGVKRIRVKFDGTEITPETTAVTSLGTSSKQFKDAQFSGTVTAATGTFTNITGVGATTFTVAGIGATSTDGVLVTNTTAAATGAQQWSPRLRLRGFGWKTDATAASQAVDFKLEVVPVEGAAAPTGNLVIGASINGGAFSTVGTFTSGGQLLHPDGTAAAPAIAGTGSSSNSGPFIAGVDTWNWSFNGSAVVNFVGSGMQMINGGCWQWASGLTGGTAANLALCRAADGSLRVGSDISGTNRYDITLADWGTTLSAEAVSVADAAVLTGPTSGAGFLIVSIGTDNNVCTFALTGTSAPVEINDPGTLCSVTALTASSVNVYYSSGYKIENLRGGTRALRIMFIGG